MNINKKIEGEIVSEITPFNTYYQSTVDHAPGSPSKYITTIYNYFCIKNDIFRRFESKKFMKICSKTHQIAPIKFFFGEACPWTPLANAWLYHASQAPPPTKQNEIVGPPWQILHTPMNYYWEIYLRIHPGRQLIVCSTLYVYALQNLFRWQKMTKIVAQHILKCITWTLFSNTMCP